MEHNSNEQEGGGAFPRLRRRRKSVSHPAARMLETAGARAPVEDEEKKPLICIANELL